MKIVEVKRNHNEFLKLYFDLLGEETLFNFFNHRCWVVRDKGKAVAFCSSVVRKERYVYFSSCGVTEDYRGKGLQRRMIRHRLKKAKEDGAEVAYTYTSKDNEPSFLNLQREGFELYVPEDEYAGRDFLYWRKYL